MTAKPATKKVHRRPLNAPEDRPSRLREAEAGSAYAAEPNTKLSVDVPESLHVALKQYCVGKKVKIREWLIDHIKQDTGQ